MLSTTYDLKLGDFKAAYKGQMELYLRWLDKHERQPEEASPLGIILCAGKRQEMVELLELDQSGIHVAEYLTALPPKALLQQKLHTAIEQSSNRGSVWRIEAVGTSKIDRCIHAATRENTRRSLFFQAQNPELD